MRTTNYRLAYVFLAAVCWCTGAFSVTHAQVSVVSDLAVERSVQAGASYQETIQIRNETSTEQVVRLYQRDYLFNASGSNHYLPPDSTRRSNASWINHGPAQRTIPPGEVLSITVTVNVPVSAEAEAALEGTYWSMVMVESIGQQADAEDGQQLGIASRVRYGVQIITHMGETGAPKITFKNPELTKTEKGSPLLYVNLENEGNRSTVPKVWAEVYNSQGTKEGTFSGAPVRLYPGTSVRQQILLEGIASGTYTVLVIADAGDDQVYGVKYPLEL